MTCFLESVSFPNRKNAEGLSNLPPKKRGEGKRGFVSDPLPKIIFNSTFPPEKRQRGERSFPFRPVSPKHVGSRKCCLEPDPFHRRIKRGEETGVEPCPYFAYIEIRGNVVSSLPCLAERMREQKHSVPLYLLSPGLFLRGRRGKSLFQVWSHLSFKAVVKYVGGFWPIGVFFAGYRSFFFVPSRQTQTKERL